MILLVAMHYHTVKLAEILSSEAGKNISYVDVTVEDARKGMKQVGADGLLMLC